MKNLLGKTAPSCRLWVTRAVSSIRAARRLNPNNRTTFTYVGGRVEMVRLPEFAIDAAEQRRLPVAS